MSRRLMLYAALLAVVGAALISSPSFAGQGDTWRVSVSSSATQGDGDSLMGDRAISGDGRYVVFNSLAMNLVAGDTNGVWDVFVHDQVTGTTERVSVSSSGGQGNSSSTVPCISADGRYVAFASAATNLVVGDTYGVWDVFVHDRVTGATERVSVSSSGEQADSMSYYPAISADGRYVAFMSSASNLVVAGDTNGQEDVFVHDRLTGATERISVSTSGEQSAGGQSTFSSISADGRYVAFMSGATNLVAGDTNGCDDMFVHDRLTGTTERVSVSSAGGEGNSASVSPSISADGRYVAFMSGATNLVAGDINGQPDVFVHDRVTGATERVSVSSAGVGGNDMANNPSISADGRYVAFDSSASNLISGDTNTYTDIFVHDRVTGATERVSVSSSGEQGDDSSFYAALSADGRYVAFASWSTNLVDGDTSGREDIFVHQYLPDIAYDVAIAGLRIYPRKWAQGVPNQLAILDIKNLGNVPETAARAKWLLDDDPNFNDAATDPTPPVEIGNVTGITLAVGQTKTVQVALTPNWSPGTYYLMARVEPTTAPDVNRANNSKSASISIVVYDFAVTDIEWNKTQSAFYVTVHNDGPSRGSARINLTVAGVRLQYEGLSDAYVFLENGQTKQIKFPYTVPSAGKKICEARIVPDGGVPDSHKSDNYRKETLTVP